VKSEQALLGLKALQRAARKVAENARNNNYKIPIWKNGHIEYEIPEKPTQQQQGLLLPEESTLKLKN